MTHAHVRHHFWLLTDELAARRVDNGLRNGADMRVGANRPGDGRIRSVIRERDKAGERRADRRLRRRRS